MITEQERKEWMALAKDTLIRWESGARARELANAVRMLLQENADLLKDRQDNLDRADTVCVDGCEAEAFTTKLALANQRIEQLRRGMLDLIHSVSQV